MANYFFLQQPCFFYSFPEVVKDSARLNKVSALRRNHLLVENYMTFLMYSFQCSQTGKF